MEFSYHAVIIKDAFSREYLSNMLACAAMVELFLDELFLQIVETWDNAYAQKNTEIPF
jgi:hypothetical protein